MGRRAGYSDVQRGACGQTQCLCPALVPGGRDILVYFSWNDHLDRAREVDSPLFLGEQSPASSQPRAALSFLVRGWTGVEMGGAAMWRWKQHLADVGSLGRSQDSWGPSRPCSASQCPPGGQMSPRHVLEVKSGVHFPAAWSPLLPCSLGCGRIAPGSCPWAM